jgi:hypothetical protein
MSNKIFAFEPLRSCQRVCAGLILASAMLQLAESTPGFEFTKHMPGTTIYGRVTIRDKKDNSPPPETYVAVLIPGHKRKIKEAKIKNAKGDYEISGIRAGTYNLLAYDKGGAYDGDFKPNERILDGDNPVNFALKQNMGRVRVSGVATDSNGQPLLGANVLFYHRECDDCLIKATTTDKRGSYASDIPSESYRMAIASKSADGKESVAFLPELLQVTPNKPLGLDLQVSWLGSELSVVGYLRELPGPSAPRQEVVVTNIGSSLTGKVVFSGGAVPGVTVIVTREGGRSEKTTTDSDGVFRFLNLEPGSYTVTGESSRNFAPFRPTNVQVSLSTPAAVTVQLRPAGVSETSEVTVVSDAAIDFATTNPSGANVSDEQFLNFPTQRTVQDLYNIAQTATRSGQRDATARDPSVAGSSGPENKYILDGVATTDPVLGGSGASLPLEFVQQVGVKMSASAGVGSVFNAVTRSGTNDFRGSLRYELMNDALDARNFFNLAGLDAFRWHTGSLYYGGPLRKDRAFFFAGYELTRGAQEPIFSPVLVSQLASLNLHLGRLGLPAEDLRSLLTISTKDNPIVRLDFQLNSNHKLMISYGFLRDHMTGTLRNERQETLSAPSAAADVLTENQFLNVRHNARWTNNFFSEVLYSYQQNSLSVDSTHPQELSLLIPGLAQIGRRPNLSKGDLDRRSSHLFSGRFTAVIKNHTLSFGGELLLENHLYRLAIFDSGRAVVQDLTALSGSPPRAELFQIGTGGTQVRFDSAVAEGYVNDDFKPRSDLSLNLGVYYKAELPPSFLQKEMNGWQPRAGFAWDIGNKGRRGLKASYGILLDRLPQIPIAYELLLGGGLRSGVPLALRRVSSFVGSPATSALNQFLSGGVVTPGPQLAIVDDHRSQSPLAHTGIVTFEQRMGSNGKVRLAYDYRRGSRLLTSTDINLLPPATSVVRPDFTGRFANSSFTQIYQFETSGRSSYHAGTLGMELKLLRDLRLQSSYIFSKSLDDAPAGSFEATPENVFDRRSERSVSDFHASHRVFVSSSWTVPWGVNAKLPLIPGQLNYIIVGDNFRFSSGHFFNVLTGSDSNHDGNPLTDRPLGVGRNSFQGQNFAQLDVFARARLLFRDEKRALELTMDVSNLLNRANFVTFNTVLDRDQLTGVNPSIVNGKRGVAGYDFRHPLTPEGFGLATSADTPRRFLLGLRFSF